MGVLGNTCQLLNLNMGENMTKTICLKVLGTATIYHILWITGQQTLLKSCTEVYSGLQPDSNPQTLSS